MPLFGPKPDPQIAERSRRSQDQLARGGLPLSAESRLRDLHAHPTLFTSNLSVNEFVLAADDGVRPLAQVSGTSVFHVGWQYTPQYASAELSTVSHAHAEVRRLALARLQQEAALLKAHGVVGVQLSSRWLDEHVLEFNARGTAVMVGDAPERQAPFLSALSMQEFWTLRRAGYVPVGIAYGVCSYYCVASYTTQSVTAGGLFGGGWRGNTELTDYTKSVYKARHTAMSRMEKDAARVGAAGIVGVNVQMGIHTHEVEVNNQQRRDLRVFFSALGTAVAERRDRWPIIDYSLPLSK